MEMRQRGDKRFNNAVLELRRMRFESETNVQVKPKNVKLNYF